MPDISMCLNASCPLQKDCYRYTAPPNPYRQSYAGFKFTEENGKPKCENFWSNKIEIQDA